MLPKKKKKKNKNSYFFGDKTKKNTFSRIDAPLPYPYTPSLSLFCLYLRKKNNTTYLCGFGQKKKIKSKDGPWKQGAGRHMYKQQLLNINWTWSAWKKNDNNDKAVRSPP